MAEALGIEPSRKDLESSPPSLGTWAPMGIGTSGGIRTHIVTVLSRARLPNCATLAWWSRPPGSNRASPAYETGGFARLPWPG